MTQIALDKLAAHPGNANRMPDALFNKLVAHIKDSGDYPPIIVRTIGDTPEQYQILDGHHRVKALAQLGYTEANCEVWQADDARATLLMLTLNRLEGSDDPVKRAALIAQLAADEELKSLEAKLPEDRTKIAKLLALCDVAPELAPPVPLESMPQAVTFFLTAPQRDALMARLHEVHTDRSVALVTLLNLDGVRA